MKRRDFLKSTAGLLAIPATLSADVQLIQSTDRVDVQIGGKPFTAFYLSADYTKPFLHPLRSASGKIVTRQFPMKLVEGETRDHPHHRGVWFAHGDVNGYDFWSSDPLNKRMAQKPRIRVEKIIELKNGREQGMLHAVMYWETPEGERLLVEHRRMYFYAHPQLRMVDFDIQLGALKDVKFGDTKEGTFALRVASELEEPNPRGPQKPPRTGKIVDSEGRVGSREIWGKRARWVDYSGIVEGEHLGIAVFDHPKNFRHPTYWHARGYGLFAANPFGLHDFLGDNSVDGSLKLNSGDTVRFRYRVVVHPGDAVSADIEKLYNDYVRQVS